MAVSELLKEALWLIMWIEGLGVEREDITPIQVFMDSKGADDLARNGRISTYTKHIDMRRHCLRDYVAKGDIKISHIPGIDNPADLFTKALPEPKFVELRRKLGVFSLDEAIQKSGGCRRDAS